MNSTTGADAAHTAGAGAMFSTWRQCGHCKDKLDVLDNRCARRLDHDMWHAHAAQTATLFEGAKQRSARHPELCPHSLRPGQVLLSCNW